MAPVRNASDSSSISASSTFIIEGALTNVNKKYKLLKVIGKGTFGTVRRCKLRKTGELLACKTILKSQVPNVEILQREIEILREVSHPHIIRLHDVYEDERNIHLITELCTGGELYDRVLEKTSSPEGHFSEYDAARIIRNILDAINYCHTEKHIVHRDLKPENFLLLDESDDAPVKIIDFGLSRHCAYGTGPDGRRRAGIMQSRVGTTYYVAPEVLTDDYTNKCDVWSIGVISYILLSGFPPFYGKNDRDTLKLVQEAQVQFPNDSWDDISDEAKRFIRRLLNRDPELRPSAEEALKDSWLRNDEVQPAGVSRRASFACGVRTSARHIQQIVGREEDEDKDRDKDDDDDDKVQKETTVPEPQPQPQQPPALRMKHEKRGIFQKFMTMVKVRKAVAHAKH